MDRPARIALAIFFGVPLSFLVLFSQCTHGHPEFVVMIHGRILLRDHRDRRSRAIAMVFPTHRWATDPQMVGWTREAVRRRELGPQRGADSLDSPPAANGAIVGERGEFSIGITTRWTASYSASIRYTDATPPPRFGLEALRIEIEGRDPIILDMPEGTWTERDGEDGLWATWDLGVMEVPRRP